MQPWNTCVICRKRWPEGQSPLCSHTEQEWREYQARLSEPEDQSRNARRATKQARLTITQ